MTQQEIADREWARSAKRMKKSSAFFKVIAGISTMTPCSPTAEATDLKSVECSFKSNHGDRRFKTNCAHGHAFDAANTIIQKGGKRPGRKRCRKCFNASHYKLRRSQPVYRQYLRLIQRFKKALASISTCPFPPRPIHLPDTDACEFGLWRLAFQDEITDDQIATFQADLYCRFPHLYTLEARYVFTPLVRVRGDGEEYEVLSSSALNPLEALMLKEEEELLAAARKRNSVISSSQSSTASYSQKAA